MSDKPWANTGLGDFRSWLGDTHPRDGLIYRGDIDFDQLGPRGMLTVVEFKKQGENIPRGQLAYLKRRAQDDRTEVRVVKETTDDYTDPNRDVVFWDPTTPWANRIIISLTDVADWVDSRAYRSKRIPD